MMLSSKDIINAQADGRIVIEPFDKMQLNPNSYDLRLGPWFFLLRPENGIPIYHGPIQVPLWDTVYIPAGGTLLGMTQECIGTFENIVVQLHAKSSTRRMGISVCDDAGLGDVGYHNHWTVELTANTTTPVGLVVGELFAQAVFYETKSPPLMTYKGQYNQSLWPMCMIPQRYRHENHVRGVADHSLITTLITESR